MPYFKLRAYYGPYSYERTVKAEYQEKAEAILWNILNREGKLSLPMAARSVELLSIEDDDE